MHRDAAIISPWSGLSKATLPPSPARGRGGVSRRETSSATRRRARFTSFSRAVRRCSPRPRSGRIPSRTSGRPRFSTCACRSAVRRASRASRPSPAAWPRGFPRTRLARFSSTRALRAAPSAGSRSRASRPRSARRTPPSAASSTERRRLLLTHARRQTGTIEDGPIDPARASDLFETAGLDPALLPALGLVARTVLPGAALLAAGERGEEAFLVAEGRLRVSLEIAGGEEALAILGRGEIAGEMALVDDAPRSADVFAHGGPAVVYVLTRAVFRELLASGAPEGAALLAGIALVLTRRLEEAIKKAAGFRILAGPI